MRFFANRKDRIIPSILICVCFGLMGFIATPLDIFANNLDEFLFSASDFLGWELIWCLSISVVFFSILYFTPDIVYKFFKGLIGGFTFMMFVQSLFLNGSMNSLEGDNLTGNGTYSNAQLIINLIVWVIVIAGFIVFNFLKKPSEDNKKLVYILLFFAMTFAQVITPVTDVISHNNLFENALVRSQDSENQIEPKALTTKNMTDVAQDRNVLVFIIDRFDEIFAQRAYDYNTEIYDSLEGFTWFKDNISYYNHTFPAVAYMLTRETFDLNSNRSDYLNSVYRKDTPLGMLNNNGYKINLFIEQYYSYTDATFLPNYIQNTVPTNAIKTENKFQLSLRMLELSGYRHFPIIMKNIFKYVTSSTCNELTHHTSVGDLKDYESTNAVVLNDVSTDFNVTGTADKQFTFIHVAGCHALDIAKEPSNYQCYYSVNENMKILNHFLDALKTSGKYKDSTIIVTGDHGCPHDSFNEIIDNPFQTALFMKRSGEDSGSLKVSNAQVCQENLWASICQSEGLENSYGRSFYDIGEEETMERYIQYQSYSRNTDVWYYKVTGPGNDLNNYDMYDQVHYANRFIMD